MEKPIVYAVTACLGMTSIILLGANKNSAALALACLASVGLVFSLIPTRYLLLQPQPQPGNATDTVPDVPGTAPGQDTTTTSVVDVVTLPVVLPPPDVAQEARDYLPRCTVPEVAKSAKDMRDMIRNNGLYGIHGDTNCRMMQRASIADKGVRQPLAARTELMQFLGVDLLHRKDQTLMPRKPTAE